MISGPRMIIINRTAIKFARKRIPPDGNPRSLGLPDAVLVPLFRGVSIKWDFYLMKSFFIFRQNIKELILTVKA